VSNAFFPRLNHQHRSFELRQLLDMWLQCPLVSMRIAQNEIVLHSLPWQQRQNQTISQHLSAEKPKTVLGSKRKLVWTSGLRPEIGAIQISVENGSHHFLCCLHVFFMLHVGVKCSFCWSRSTSIDLEPVRLPLERRHAVFCRLFMAASFSGKNFAKHGYVSRGNSKADGDMLGESTKSWGERRRPNRGIRLLGEIL